MADRKISKKLKGKVFMSCVMSVCLYGLEMMTLTERQQHRLQICKNNWVRTIAGVKRVAIKRMDKLREVILCRLD